MMLVFDNDDRNDDNDDDDDENIKTDQNNNFNKKHGHVNKISFKTIHYNNKSQFRLDINKCVDQN